MKELKWSLEQDSNDNDNALPLLAQKKCTEDTVKSPSWTRKAEKYSEGIQLLSWKKVLRVVTWVQRQSY
jgi:hypothetical protein